MAKNLCHNITSDDQNNYAAPVPIIGFYIVGASLVCFLFMIFDIVHGIRRRRLWLPCRWFSLNSVTLLLLSVAAKLPVDLTTPMPSAWDQLSKLTGTAFVCVSMCFLLPSLGTKSTSECSTNMAALTIFVITLIVNICIQISTGVIFSFIPEHIIIMFFMLTMLCLLWTSTWSSNIQKEILMDCNSEIFREGKGSVTMLQRLKLCYLHGYNSDPQVFLCRIKIVFYADILCLFCLIVVLQVSFRTIFSHDLSSCSEISDYGWSMRIVVVTQILVILLASLTTAFRGLIMFDQMDDNYKLHHDESDGIEGNQPFLNNSDGECKNDILRLPVFCWSGIAAFLLVLPELVALRTCHVVNTSFKRKYAQPEEAGIQEYKQLMRENNIAMEGWTLTRCADDIKRWTSIKERYNSLSNLKEFLSTTRPSGTSLEQLCMPYNFHQGNEVSSLHLVFLQRIASVSIPSLGGRLRNILSEAFDIIHFVDTKINSSSYAGRKRCRLAKAMWKGKNFSSVVHKYFRWHKLPTSDLDRAVVIISKLKNVLPSTFIWSEVSFVMDSINIPDRSYATMEELFRYMEQLFVDMLHMFLIQIPDIIYKEVTESPPEEYMNKVRHAVKLISQVESLDGIVQWSFHNVRNINGLIHDPASLTDRHDPASPTDSHDPASLTDRHDPASPTDRHDNSENACHDEIIQVE